MDRFGIARVVGAGGVLGAAKMLLVVAAGTPITGLAGFALAGGGLSVVAPQAFAAAGRAVPEQPASAVARVNVCAYARLRARPALIGTIAALTSLRGGFLAALVLIVGLTAAAPRLGGATRPAARP